MDVKLVVSKGKNAGKQIRVARPKFFIGRAEDCHLRPLNELVSRHHCAIIVENGVVSVRDFGSKNGTYVNDDRITGDQVLTNGDRLRVCELEFEVQVDVGVGGEMKPKVESVQEAAARTVESNAEEEHLDLDNWLKDTRMSDHMQDTDTVAASSLQAESESSAEEPKKEEQKPADVVGVWKGGRWKPTSANPRDAAADTLKNFFKRQ